MKALILVVALVAIVAAPVLSFACPPPPCPGYDGGGVSDGPGTSGDGGGYVKDGGGKDTDSGNTSGDATCSETTI